MDINERAKVTDKLFEECREIMAAKGADYAGQQQTDANANFKRNAERLGLTKYQIWAVYFNKHVDSINNAIAISPGNPQAGAKSERLKGRIQDIINYTVILFTMLEEDTTVSRSKKNEINIAYHKTGCCCVLCVGG